MAINTTASSDARHARTGKDAAIYDGDGNMLATVDQFQAQSNFNNVQYTPLGDPQEHEAANSYSITITFQQIVIQDETMMENLISAMQDGELPVCKFQGTLKGRNGSEERVVYPECIFSGNQDIQNFSNGDVIRRAFSMFCNGKPQKMSDLSI